MSTPFVLFSGGVFVVLGFGYLFARPWRRKPQLPDTSPSTAARRAIVLGVLAMLVGVLALVSGLTALVTWNAAPTNAHFYEGIRQHAAGPATGSGKPAAGTRRSRRWVPTVATPLLILTAALLGRAWHRATRRVARLQTQHCEQCGYSLRGLSEPRCPECGTPFDPSRAGQVPGSGRRLRAGRRSPAISTAELRSIGPDRRSQRGHWLGNADRTHPVIPAVRATSAVLLWCYGRWVCTHITDSGRLRFPSDHSHQRSQTGTPAWLSLRRCPTPSHGTPVKVHQLETLLTRAAATYVDAVDHDGTAASSSCIRMRTRCRLNSPRSCTPECLEHCRVGFIVSVPEPTTLGAVQASSTQVRRPCRSDRPTYGLACGRIATAPCTEWTSDRLRLPNLVNGGTDRTDRHTAGDATHDCH